MIGAYTVLKPLNHLDDLSTALFGPLKSFYASRGLERRLVVQRTGDCVLVGELDMSLEHPQLLHPTSYQFHDTVTDLEDQERLVYRKTSGPMVDVSTPLFILPDSETYVGWDPYNLSLNYTLLATSMGVGLVNPPAGIMGVIASSLWTIERLAARFFYRGRGGFPNELRFLPHDDDSGEFHTMDFTGFDLTWPLRKKPTKNK